MIGLAQLALTAALAAASPASVGVGMQVGPVCLPTTAHPGTSYTLAPVEVQNTGSGDENLSLQVHPQPGPAVLPGKTVPPSWVQFTYPRGWLGMTAESSVRVSPGPVKTAVPARLNVPAAAAPGIYVSWIEVSVSGSGVPGGHLNLGAAAATPIEFEVTKPGTPVQHAGCFHLRSAPPAHHAGHKGRRHATASPAAQPIRLNGNEVAAVAGVILVAAGAVVLWLRRRV